MSIITKPAYKSYDVPKKERSDSTGEPSPSAQSVIKAEVVKSCMIDNWDSLINETASIKSNYQVVNTIDAPQNAKKSLVVGLNKVTGDFLRSCRVRKSSSLFIKHMMIGKGGFGRVYLVTDKFDNQLYALKVVPKSTIIENGLVENIQGEKKALNMVHNSPFVVKMHSTFQDNMNLYFQLEFVPGGDLRKLMNNFYLNENTIKFIIGEIILALEEVHKHNILHLDVKPSNILMGVDGHLKITDFGVSVILNDENLNFYNLINNIFLQQKGKEKMQVVSLSYVAPEVLINGCPTIKSDLWSVGVILYELIYRKTPLTIDEIKSIRYDNRFFQEFLKFPSLREDRCFFLSTAMPLLTALLSPENERPTLEELKKFQFFEDFDFDNPRANLPPLVPSLPNPFDPSKYNCEELFLTDTKSEVEMSDWTRVAFLGFTSHQKYQTIEPEIIVADNEAIDNF